MSVLEAGLLHALLRVELDDGRLLAVGAHVLPRESDWELLTKSESGSQLGENPINSL